ncbi:MAG: tetratricopeptide repeat protein, partial [Nitrospinota bacterium]
VSTGKDGCVEASTFYNKGVARQDFSQAEIDFYKKAISLCKDHYKSHFNLGVVYKKLKRYSEAKAEFKEVIRIKNDLADAHYNLGEIYDTLNDLGFAIEEYRETIRFDPNKLNAHYNLAGIFASLKQYDRAKGALEESLRIDPSHTPSLVLLKKVDKNLKTRKNE